MVRMLISLVIQLVSNALGLLVAAWALDKVTITGSAFLIAVVIFTVVYALAQPFLTQIAISKAPALRGGVALIATLVGLVVTAWISDGLQIDGLSTWFVAALIVWAVSLIGVFLIPLIFVKKRVEEKKS